MSVKGEEGYPLKRLLRATNPVELHAAARDLSRIRDGDNPDVVKTLQQGERIFRQYQLGGERARRNKRAEECATLHKLEMTEDDIEKLPSKKDMKRSILNLNHDVLEKKNDETGLTGTENVLLPHLPGSQNKFAKLYKQDLWSDKSKKIYNQLGNCTASYFQLEKGFDFQAIRKISLGSEIGVVNTFMASKELPGTLERMSGEWKFSHLTFIYKEEMLHSSEVESQLLEPLGNMYSNFLNAKRNIDMTKPYYLQSSKMRKYVYEKKKQEVMRDKFVPYSAKCTEPVLTDGIFLEQGVTANLPIMSGCVLKAVRPDGTLHLRPLCTTGDLLLALNQLMDPEIFEDGMVQLTDPHRDLMHFRSDQKGKGVTIGGVFGNCQTAFTHHDDRCFLRLDYVYRKHTRWSKLTYNSNNEKVALKDYACPTLCRGLYTEQELTEENVTPQMRRALHILRAACLPSSDEYTGEERKEAAEKFVAELHVDFEILYPCDREVYVKHVHEMENVKRLEQEKLNIPATINDIRVPEFEIRVLNIPHIKVTDVPNRNRLTLGGVQQAVLMMQAVNKFKEKKGFAKPPRIVRDKSSETDESVSEEDLDSSTSSVCEQSHQSTEEITDSIESSADENSCSSDEDGEGIDGNGDVLEHLKEDKGNVEAEEKLSNKRRSSSIFQVSIPRRKPGGPRNVSSPGFADYERRNSHRNFDVEDASLEERQYEMQKKVLALWGIQQERGLSNDELRKRIQGFRQQALNNKLQNRQVSNFVEPSEKQAMVKSVVGNRRLSVLNGVVVNSELLSKTADDDIPQLSLQRQLQNRGVMKESLEQIKKRNPDFLQQFKQVNDISGNGIESEKALSESPSKLSPFQQRKKTLGKLITKVDANIVSSEAAIKEASMSLPPCQVSNATAALPEKFVSGMRIMSELEKGKTVAQKKLSSAPKVVTSERRTSVRKSRKKSIRRGSKPKLSSFSNKSIARVGTVEAAEEKSIEEDQADYSVHTVPSVLSNREFNQKHEHRRKTLVKRKTKKSMESQDEDFDSQSDDGVLDMGSPNQRTCRGDRFDDDLKEKSASLSSKGNNSTISVQLPLVNSSEQLKQLDSDTPDMKTEDINTEADNTAEEVLPEKHTAQISDDQSVACTSQDGDVDFARLILQSHDSVCENPFQQHVSSIDCSCTQEGQAEDLSIQNIEENSELAQIVRLLENKVKDSRYAYRREYLRGKRLSTERNEREQQLFLKECEAALEGIMDRIDPVLGERVVLSLRKRQERRRVYHKIPIPTHPQPDTQSVKSPPLDSEDNNIGLGSSIDIMRSDTPVKRDNNEHTCSTGGSGDIKNPTSDDDFTEQDICAMDSFHNKFKLDEEERLIKLKALVGQRRKEANERRVSVRNKLSKRLQEKASIDKQPKQIVTGSGSRHSVKRQKIKNKQPATLRANIVDISDTAKLPYSIAEEEHASILLNENGSNTFSLEDPSADYNKAHLESQEDPIRVWLSGAVLEGDWSSAEESLSSNNIITEDRIDEVVGGFSLSQLKRFRAELFKYVHFVEDLESCVAEVASHHDDSDNESNQSVQLEFSSVDMHVDPKHIADSMDLYEVKHYEEAEELDEPNPQPSTHEENEPSQITITQERNACSSFDSDDVSKSDVRNETVRRSPQQINAISSSNVLRGKAIDLSLNSQPLQHDPCGLDAASVGISLGSVDSFVERNQKGSETRSPRTREHKATGKTFNKEKKHSNLNSKIRDTKPLLLRIAELGDFEGKEGAGSPANSNGKSEGPQLVEGAENSQSPPRANNQTPPPPHANSVVIDMQISSAERSVRKSEAHIIKELPARRCLAVRARSATARAEDTADASADIEGVKSQDKTSCEDQSLEDLSGVGDTNDKSLSISVDKDTVRAVEFLPSSQKPGSRRDRGLDKVAFAYAQAPSLNLNAPDPDGTNIDELENMQKKYLEAVAGITPFAFPDLGGSMTFDLEKTQTQDLSSQDEAHKNDPPTSSSGKKVLAVKTADLSVTAQGASSWGGVMNSAQKNSFRGNPKPPRATKPSREITPLKKKRVLK